MRDLAVNATGPDGPVFSDDSIEIFLDPGNRRAAYIHLAITANGIQADSPIGAWQSVAGKAADYWCLEVAIPLEALIGPDTAPIWGVNLNRNERPHNQLSGWRPTFGPFHTPDKFGAMDFEQIDFTALYRELRDKRMAERHVLAAGQDCEIQAVSASLKVKKDEVTAGMPAVNLCAARAESAAFQVLVVPHTASAEPFAITGAELQRPDGVALPASVLHWFEVGYIGTMPDVLYPPGEFAGQRGRDRFLWVRIDVPADAAPGIYAGSLTVTTPTESLSVPVTLKVWDYTLPPGSHLKTALFSLAPGRVAAWYGHPIGSREYLDLIRPVFESYARNRISPGSALPGYWYEFGTRKISRPDHYRYRHLKSAATFEDGICGSAALAYFDQWAEFWTSRGLDLNFMIMSPVDRALDTAEDMIAMEKFWRVWYPHLVERGWAEKSYVRPFGDEFKSWIQAEEGRKRALAIRELAPKVKILVTHSCRDRRMADYIKDVTDIWAPNSFFGDGAINAYLRQRQKEGALICPYIHGAAMLNNTAIRLRRFFWETWLHQADGCALWSVNDWFFEPESESRMMEKLPDGSFAAHTDKISWGAAGVLLWPGKNGILDSVRWETIGQGLTDYEHLRLAGQMRDDDRLPSDLRGRIGAVLTELTDNFAAHTTTPDQMESFRERLGDLIEQCAQDLKKQ